MAATALHAGFQLTVTLLVYPGFAAVPDDGWSGHHARHTRRIVPLVAVVYGLLVAAGVAVLIAGPTPGQRVALGFAGVALLLTATVAAPAHGRLDGGRDPAVLRRLILADRGRCAAAVLATVTAVLA